MVLGIEEKSNTLGTTETSNMKGDKNASTATEPCEKSDSESEEDIVAPLPKPTKSIKAKKGAQEKIRKVCEGHLIRLEDVDFENKRHLGHGAFCDIDEVSMNQQKLALKRLSPISMTGAPPQELIHEIYSLALEASMLAKVEHENIVKMHGISGGSILEDGTVTLDDDKKSFFFLLDRLETTLDKQISKWKRAAKEERPPSWRLRKKSQYQSELLLDRLEVALGMAKGLQHLHEHKIVHCDIKPENVGFDKNGVVKIFDLGLSVKQEKQDDESLSGTRGTPVYMASEILHVDKKKYGKKVDVFAFAITLWQMCALESCPVYETNVRNHWDYGFRSTEDRPKMQNWWPTKLKDLMSDCWRSEPSERPTGAEIAQTIEAILVQEGRKQCD